MDSCADFSRHLAASLRKKNRPLRLAGTHSTVTAGPSGCRRLISAWTACTSVAWLCSVSRSLQAFDSARSCTALMTSLSFAAFVPDFTRGSESCCGSAGHWLTLCLISEITWAWCFVPLLCVGASTATRHCRQERFNFGVSIAR